MRFRENAVSALAAAAVAACAGGSGTETPAPRALMSLAVPFAAQVGERPIACGERYEGMGATGSTITPTDFRLFVSEVELIDRRGRAFRLAPGDARPWEHAGVTLLDFENGSGPCANGNAETNHVVLGRVPPGDYRGLRFTVGVPFAMNHLDHNLQPAPLNVTSMFWAWRSGYKFLRLDFRTSGPAQNLFVHVGSTGCVARDTLSTQGPESCSEGNRARIELSGFRPGRDTVLLDVAALLAGANLDENQPQTAKGCMSAPNDADCAPIFHNLGLAFGGRAAPIQRVFRLRGPVLAGP